MSAMRIAFGSLPCEGGGTRTVATPSQPPPAVAGGGAKAGVRGGSRSHKGLLSSAAAMRAAVPRGGQSMYACVSLFKCTRSASRRNGASSIITCTMPSRIAAFSSLSPRTAA